MKRFLALLHKGDSLEITLNVRFFPNFLWLFLIMQVFEMCDKKQMARCSFKSHNSSKVRQKSDIMCAFLLLNAAPFRGISGQTHGVNIKKSQ